MVCGCLLPAAFYRDHPQFAGAAGQVEVLAGVTVNAADEMHGA
jgi:hypothetical protein